MALPNSIIFVLFCMVIASVNCNNDYKILMDHESSISWPETLRIAVKNGQYIDVKVGLNPGRDSVIMRLSWAIDEIFIYIPPLPDTYSNTYSISSSDNNKGTELFVISGYVYENWPVRYVSAGSLGIKDDDDTSDKVTHQGILGLSKKSPLRRYWPQITWSWSDIWLGSPPESIKWKLKFQFGKDKIRGCIKDRCFWIKILLDIDYTYLSDDLYSWWASNYGGFWANESLSGSEGSISSYSIMHMFVVKNSDPCHTYYSPECKSNRGEKWTMESKENLQASVHILLNPTALDNNDNTYESIRKLRSINQTAAQALPNSDQIEMWLGREHLHGIIISYDAITDYIYLAELPVSLTESEQYIWVIIVCIVFIIFWFPGVFENIHRTKYAKLTHTKQLPITAFGEEIVLWTLRDATRITSISIFLILQFSLHSYQAVDLLPYFVKGVSSQTMYWILIAISLGFSLSLPIYPLYKNLPLFFDFSQTISLCLIGWLVIVVQFHNLWVLILMAVLSGTVFRLTSWILLDKIFSEKGFHDISRNIWMIFITFILWIGSAWFFAFYNIGIYIEQQYPSLRYAQWALCAFILTAVFFGYSFFPFVDEKITILSAIINMTNNALEKQKKNKNTQKPNNSQKEDSSPQDLSTSNKVPHPVATDAFTSISDQYAGYSQPPNNPLS